jgi:hypothetical protein
MKALLLALWSLVDFPKCGVHSILAPLQGVIGFSASADTSFGGARCA